MSRPTLRLFDGFKDNSPELKDEVKELQQLLKAEGYQVKTDGLFGRDTEMIIKRFQSDKGLDDDGVVSTLTWAALLKENPPDISKVFPTTFPREHDSLKKQLNEALKYKAFIAEFASAYSFPHCIIGGIGSRESMWGLALKPLGPEGTGDTIKRKYPTAYRTGPLPTDGGGYGRGLMQVDFDAHEFARTGKWKDPKENINYGCQVLSNCYQFMKRKSGLTGNELLRASIAGYNCGPGNVLRAIRDGKDIDYFTFGRDYSKDVMNRAGWFQLNGWE